MALFAARFDADRVEVVQDFATPGCVASEQSLYEPPPKERRCRKEPPPYPSSVYQLLVPAAGLGFSTSFTVPCDSVRPCGRENGRIVWRHGRVAVAIAEPDRVSVAQHDVIRARAAVDGLVKVVAHRIFIREFLEVRRVALLHVVKAQRGRTFLRSDRRRRAG